MVEAPDFKRSPAERQAIIRNITVEHDRYAEAIGALEEFHYPIKGGAHASGSVAALIGDSRTGKSFSTRRYASRFPARVGRSGLIMPVAYADMPMEGGGGARGVLEAIATALQIQFSLRMTNPALLALILRSIVDRQVELLLLDEFEQVFRENDKRLIGFGRGLIRKILNLNTTSVVCIGLLGTYTLLKQDDQLVGRGGLPHCHLRPYSWDNKEERDSFRLLCGEFDRLLPFELSAGLGAPGVAHRLFTVSGGNIGKLKGWIEAAAAHAINDDAPRIELAHFARAFERRKEPGTQFNPFVQDPSLIEVQPALQMKRGRSGSAAQIFSKAKLAEVGNGY
jgi:hypothetical protein